MPELQVIKRRLLRRVYPHNIRDSARDALTFACLASVFGAIGGLCLWTGWTIFILASLVPLSLAAIYALFAVVIPATMAWDAITHVLPERIPPPVIEEADAATTARVNAAFAKRARTR